MIQVVAYARFTLYGTHGEAPHRRLMKGRRYTQRIERHDRPVEIGRYSPCLCLYEERLVGLTTNRKKKRTRKRNKVYQAIIQQTLV